MLRDTAHTAIRAARETKGFSQEALAYRAGVSARTIRAVEQGDRAHHRGTIRKLAEVLGLDVTDLFDPDEVSA